MTSIRQDLRDEIHIKRTHPFKWGEEKPRGITQRELAEKTRLSEVWIRQIERGTKPSASPNALGKICYILGIRPDWLLKRRYNDVALITSMWESRATAKAN